MKRIILVLISLAAVLAAATGIPSVPAAETGAGGGGRSGEVRVLALLCAPFGTNTNLMRDWMELYGWTVTTTGVVDSVARCAYGGPYVVDTLVSEIDDVTAWDILFIMPSRAWTGNSHAQLLADQDALDLVAAAAAADLVVASMCGGTRVLAAADVIDGRQVTGRPEYLAEYEAAGATYVTYPVPPVQDGNIITSRDGQYYGRRICEVARATLDSLRAAKAGD
ncbi:MAG: DJ-1/PfpI family protein [Candidatus Eisenbacteria bacterium]|nr:DJ-1/PfpI family protein [Candidatus Eisenbacteria bacterium]